ncbi:MAG: TlpA family protein disulfide reductase [Bacteroidetes bacterium]|nr:TlpA family protein disulfide reductase [Bacteroidota bacterium]
MSVGKLIFGSILLAGPYIVLAQPSALTPCYQELIRTRKQITADVPPQMRALMSNPVERAAASGVWSECVRGKSIPALDFTSIRGVKFNDSNLRGKVLVINFWSRSCKPCVAEMPSLNKLYQEFKGRNVVFIGFATNSEEALRATYLHSGKFLFNLVANSRDIANRFQFVGYPTTYIVDQNGRIADAWSGYSPLMIEPHDRARPTILRLLSQDSEKSK